MGGYGSGRRWGAARCKLEDCHVLGGPNMLPKLIRLSEGCPFSGTIWWTRNEEKYAEIGYRLNGLTLTLNYTVNKEKELNYPVTLITTTQPNGGRRYWFKCPLRGCGRMTEKLYLPNGALYFGCRKCYNLTYESCNESHKFDGLYGLLARNMGTSFNQVKEAMRER